VLQAWAELRDNWCKAHGLVRTLEASIWNQRYRAIPEAERRAFEREQLRRQLVELDRCHGRGDLKNHQAASVVGDSLRFFDGRFLRCGDFIVLPTHVHWLVLPYPRVKLERVLQSTKRFSATRINRILERRGRLWQPDSFDHIVRDTDELFRIREYIQQNGAKAGLPPEDYLYFRADWL
jgi:type I restriction enzyme R subunit